MALQALVRIDFRTHLYTAELNDQSVKIRKKSRCRTFVALMSTLISNTGPLKVPSEIILGKFDPISGLFFSPHIGRSYPDCTAYLEISKIYPDYREPDWKKSEKTRKKIDFIKIILRNELQVVWKSF